MWSIAIQDDALLFKDVSLLNHFWGALLNEFLSAFERRRCEELWKMVDVKQAMWKKSILKILRRTDLKQLYSQDKYDVNVHPNTSFLSHLARHSSSLTSSRVTIGVHLSLKMSILS